MADDPQYDSGSIQNHPAFSGAAEEAAQFAEGYDKFFKTGATETASERIEREFDESRQVADPPKAEAPPEPPASQPSEQLIFGKYKSLEDAEKGYYSAVQLAKSALQERDELRTSAAPPQPEGPDPYVESLKEIGVPPEAITAMAERAAEKKLQALFAPILAEAKAEQDMARAHKGYVQEKESFEQFMLNNPEVLENFENARKSGQNLLAREWAWMKYEASRTNQTREVAQANAAVRKELVEEAKKDAGVTTSKRADARSKKDELSDEEFERLKAYNRAGHGSLLWRNTIGKGLPDELFR